MSDPIRPSEEVVRSGDSVNQGLKRAADAVISLVRSRTRDFPELNRLIAGKESEDRDILLAIIETIEDFNTTPPLIEPVGLADFPSVSLLVNGTLIRLLTSVGLLSTRNQLNYVDSGGQGGIADKTPAIMNWLQLFMGQYEQKKVALKMALNLRGALNGGGLSSEYALLDGYWTDL